MTWWLTYKKSLLRSTPRYRQPSSLTLRYLDAARVNHADNIDLSQTYHPKLRILPTFTTQHITYSHGEFRDSSSFRVQVAFPSNTRGFLYYHRLTNTPATAGEIRFKIENTFRDLSLPNHLPWNIPLLSIASQTYYHGFRTLLLKEKLVTPQLLTRCKTLASSFTPPLTKYNRPSTIIHSLHQPFLVDFDTSALNFWLLSDNHVRRGQIDLHFGAKDVPYTGMSSNLMALTRLQYFNLLLHPNFFSGFWRLCYMSIREISLTSAYKTARHCNALPPLRDYDTQRHLLPWATTRESHSICHSIQPLQSLGLWCRQNESSSPVGQTRCRLQKQRQYRTRGVFDR